MAEPKNNNLVMDRIEIRQYRVLRMQNNIDTYAVELGVAGPLLQWAKSCNTRFQDAVTDAHVEAGEAKDETLLLGEKFNESLVYYQDTKEILEALLKAYKPDAILLSSYGIDKPSPDTHKGVYNAMDDLIKTHDRLVAEGDPRVVAQAIIDHLTVLRDELDATIESSGVEHYESTTAFQLQHTYFNEDTDNLRLIFKIACMVWGDDDSRLKLLGFLPSSEIWTENKPPHPTNFAHDGMKFTWDAVADVDEYEIDYRLTGASGDWTQLYKGAATSTVGEPAEPGEFDFRIRSWKGDDSGAWSGVIVVNFSGGALVGVPTGFTFDDAKQFFVWDDVVAADKYYFEVSRDGGQTWIMKYEGADAKFDGKQLDPGKCLARVRALNPTEISPWGITLEVWLGVSGIPANLRWHPEEHGGHLEALIEWDLTAGADTYEVMATHNGGDIIYQGPNTFIYEDILGTPRTYTYKVCGKNAFGVSDWSAALVIVIA